MGPTQSSKDVKIRAEVSCERVSLCAVASALVWEFLGCRPVGLFAGTGEQSWPHNPGGQFLVVHLLLGIFCWLCFSGRMLTAKAWNKQRYRWGQKLPGQVGKTRLWSQHIWYFSLALPLISVSKASYILVWMTSITAFSRNSVRLSKSHNIVLLFLTVTTLMIERWYLAILTCISLIVSDVEHLFPDS